jgi:tetratricopeptide (TPR) repeat protein
VLPITYYLCLLFTKSKTGIIAAIISLGFYFLFKFKSSFLRITYYVLPVTLIILSLLITNPIKDYVFPSPIISSPTNKNLNITPSENIRKIVWAGTLQLWQQFPIFGTGPETFAYSYYWTRPASHNLTSEWDFLYNKAHNEYLNYLATTGVFGFLSYLVLILFILYFLRKNLVILSAFISILITNFSGFSVVITSLYFFILPTLITNTTQHTPAKSKSFIFYFIPVSGFLFLVSKVLFFYLADITYAQADSADSAQKYTSAFENISLSLIYRPNEALYLIKSATIASKLALVAHQQKNDDLANQYTKTAINQSDKAIRLSPFSTNNLKERAQIYYYLSSLNSEYYLDAIKSLIQVTRLAPTDAKTFYLIGQFYQDMKDVDSAINYYQQAITLKTNYDYAYFALGKIYFDQKKYDLAKTNFTQTLKYAPTNPDAQEYLTKISKFKF